MTDLDWSVPEPDPTVIEREPRKCRRHDWELTETAGPESRVLEWVTWCKRCHVVRDPVRSRRGRTSLRAGKDAERLTAGLLPGAKRVGQFGSPVDVESTWAVAQVKAGFRWSAMDARDIADMSPYAHGRTRLLIKVERPGPGHQRRVQVVMHLSELLAEHGDALVVVDMPDWADLHK